jgi:hypothetical protein
MMVVLFQNAAFQKIPSLFHDFFGNSTRDLFIEEKGNSMVRNL